MADSESTQPSRRRAVQSKESKAAARARNDLVERRLVALREEIDARIIAIAEETGR